MNPHELLRLLGLHTGYFNPLKPVPSENPSDARKFKGHYTSKRNGRSKHKSYTRVRKHIKRV